MPTNTSTRSTSGTTTGRRRRRLGLDEEGHGNVVFVAVNQGAMVSFGKIRDQQTADAHLFSIDAHVLAVANHAQLPRSVGLRERNHVLLKPDSIESSDSELALVQAWVRHGDGADGVGHLDHVRVLVLLKDALVVRRNVTNEHVETHAQGRAVRATRRILAIGDVVQGRIEVALHDALAVVAARNVLVNAVAELAHDFTLALDTSRGHHKRRVAFTFLLVHLLLFKAELVLARVEEGNAGAVGVTNTGTLERTWSLERLAAVVQQMLHVAVVARSNVRTTARARKVIGKLDAAKVLVDDLGQGRDLAQTQIDFDLAVAATAAVSRLDCDLEHAAKLE